MPQDSKSLEEVIAERRKWYYSVNSVHCRYLNEPVAFNRHGFKHTLRDGRDHYRSEKDALMRLHLLPWAPRVIRNAVNMPNTELRPADHPKNKSGKPVTYFELQGVVSHNAGKRLKYIDITVILRRIGDGELHYYSIRYTKNGYKDYES